MNEKSIKLSTTSYQFFPHNSAEKRIKDHPNTKGQLSKSIPHNFCLNYKAMEVLQIFDVTTSYLTVDRQENVTSHAYRTVPEMTSGVVSTWRQHIQLLWQCNMAAFMVCLRRSHVPWYSRRLNMWHFLFLINLTVVLRGNGRGQF